MARLNILTLTYLKILNGKIREMFYLLHDNNENNGIHENNDINESNGIHDNNDIRENNDINESNGIHEDNGDCGNNDIKKTFLFRIVQFKTYNSWCMPHECGTNVISHICICLSDS